MTIPDAVTLRRDLHAHAEPGFLEYRTAATVVSSLRQLDIPHRTGAGAMDMGSVPIPPTLQEQEEWAARVLAAGAEPDLVEHMRTEGTAVVGDIEGDRPGPTWGLRIDMDALPIAEDDSPAHRPAAEGFGSRTPYMHACGHDGHTAIGLALADRLPTAAFRARSGCSSSPDEPAHDVGRPGCRSDVRRDRRHAGLRRQCQLLGRHQRIADIRRAAAGVPAVTDLIDRNDGMFGSDDAHLMILDVQRSGGTGSYIMVGGANPAPHHHPRFDVDEQALGIAVDLLEAVFRSPV